MGNFNKVLLMYESNNSPNSRNFEEVDIHVLLNFNILSIGSNTDK